uniref:Uncharacterized protein n=1 Tax=Aegilops tauschii subsp. strangulata TaxID=200361 RepID=A0A453L172_AEGTS
PPLAPPSPTSGSPHAPISLLRRRGTARHATPGVTTARALRGRASSLASNQRRHVTASLSRRWQRPGAGGRARACRIKAPTAHTGSRLPS